jgi:hypothetical protein
MEPDRFWAILEASGQGGGAAHYRALTRALAKLPAEEIVGFRRRYEALVDGAHRTDLWGAAYTINGGASDDGFFYFCVWLVSMGRRVYEAALNDPDSLAEVVDPDEEYEADLDGAPVEAWKKKTRRSDEEFFEELAQQERPEAPEREEEDWDFDDEAEVRRRLPRLAQMYLQGPGPDAK